MEYQPIAERTRKRELENWIEEIRDRPTLDNSMNYENYCVEVIDLCCEKRCAEERSKAFPLKEKEIGSKAFPLKEKEIKVTADVPLVDPECKSRRVVKRWTSPEEDALRVAVLKHGAGKWKSMLEDDNFAEIFQGRTNVDLKDKWRNLTRYS